MCDKEISHYKKIAPTLFEIVDISNPKFNATEFGLTPEAVDRHMHVQTPDGKILIGVEAFAHIWSRIPKYQWASKAIHWPLVHPAALLGYEVFARVRPYLPKRKNHIS